MWWKIFFVVLLAIQEIQILFYARSVEKLTNLTEILLMNKIKSIIATNKDGEKIFLPVDDNDEDNNAGN